MTTLADTFDQYAAQASTAAPRDIAIRRAYMAGAIAALTSKATREQLLAECVQFGRVVGTAAEKSR